MAKRSTTDLPKEQAIREISLFLEHTPEAFCNGILTRLHQRRDLIADPYHPTGRLKDYIDLLVASGVPEQEAFEQAVKAGL